MCTSYRQWSLDTQWWSSQHFKKPFGDILWVSLQLVCVCLCLLDHDSLLHLQKHTWKNYNTSSAATARITTYVIKLKIAPTKHQWYFGWVRQYLRMCTSKPQHKNKQWSKVDKSSSLIRTLAPWMKMISFWTYWLIRVLAVANREPLVFQTWMNRSVLAIAYVTSSSKIAVWFACSINPINISINNQLWFFWWLSPLTLPRIMESTLEKQDGSTASTGNWSPTKSEQVEYYDEYFNRSGQDFHQDSPHRSPQHKKLKLDAIHAAPHFQDSRIKFYFFGWIFGKRLHLKLLPCVQQMCLLCYCGIQGQQYAGGQCASWSFRSSKMWLGELEQMRNL